MRHKNIAINLLGSSMLVACCSSSSLPDIQATAPGEQPSASEKRIVRGNPVMEAEMRALLAGNPIEDAKRAVKEGDMRLWAYHQRSGKIIPGVSEIMGRAELTKTAPGMGDVIFGNAHLNLRKQLIEYMRQYNQGIIELR